MDEQGQEQETTRWLGCLDCRAPVRVLINQQSIELQCVACGHFFHYEADKPKPPIADENDALLPPFFVFRAPVEHTTI